MDMVLTKKTSQEVTLELIFSKISEFDIFRYYIGSDFKLGKAFCSPLRRDKNPSFSIGVTKSGHLQYNDYASGDCGGCIDLVEKLYGVNFPQAMKKICQDFGLLEMGTEYKKIISQYVKPILDPKRYTFIQITARKLQTADYQYWNQYHIDKEDLKREDIYAVKELYVNRKKEVIKPGELCYAYYYSEGFKIYFPQRPKGEKWKSNIPLGRMAHIENLDKSKNALVVKSLKDYMVCRKVYEFTCYCQNESIAAIPEEKARIVSENAQKVYYGGDCDVAGKAASYKITQKYRWLHINPPDRLLPIDKDFSDWAKLEGLRAIEDHLRLKNVIE